MTGMTMWSQYSPIGNRVRLNHSPFSRDRHSDVAGVASPSRSDFSGGTYHWASSFVSKVGANHRGQLEGHRELIGEAPSFATDDGYELDPQGKVRS